MRTTIILDDELGARLQNQAKREGKSFSAFLADAGRIALDSRSLLKDEPFHLITYRGDGLISNVDLDRTNELLAVEDQQLYGVRSE